ncbi:MAG: hypothetical protein DRI46_09590 [Chloroflexi bacterium]|nr:MAG: hypothetical protein DRI46_09590 [Chloroflexota bacterium]
MNNTIAQIKNFLNDLISHPVPFAILDALHLVPVPHESDNAYFIFFYLGDGTVVTTWIERECNGTVSYDFVDFPHTDKSLQVDGSWRQTIKAVAKQIPSVAINPVVWVAI